MIDPLVQAVNQPLNGEQKTYYETSGDIPMNETETESGTKEGDAVIQRHIRDHRQKPNELRSWYLHTKNTDTVEDK